MKLLGKGLAIGVAVAYPFLVFAALSRFNAAPRIISLAILLLVVFQFVALTGQKGTERNAPKMVRAAAMTALAVAALVTNSELVLKLYPVVISLSLLSAFAVTLVKAPSMILRFALLRDPGLRERGEFAAVSRYCDAVTRVWCAFFVINAGIAAYTTFFASRYAWTIYNGFVSYVLIGALLVGEYVVRRLVQKIK